MEGCSKRGGNHRELEPVQDERRNEASQIQVLWSCLVHQGPKNDASDASGDARAAGLWIYQNCRMIHMSTRIELSIFKVNWDCLILIWCYWSDKLLGINQLVLKGLKSIESGESFKGLKVHSLRLLRNPPWVSKVPSIKIRSIPKCSGPMVSCISTWAERQNLSHMDRTHRTCR